MSRGAAMILALLAGLAAMACYGVASVLQALGARHTTTAVGLDARLLVRLAGQLPYVIGIALDLVGFGFQVVALQTLPLFLVQSLIAGSVGVTALVATRWLGTSLGRGERLSLAALVLGLVLLALAAEEGPARVLAPSVGWVVLASVPVVAAVALLGERRSGRTGFLVLSACAGVAFAGVGIAARGLDLSRPLAAVLVDPMLWAVAAFGLLGALLFATVLQRGSVTVASAILFGVETLLAAGVGVLLFGDTARPGLAGLAALGLLLAVGGAVGLSPYSEPLPPATV